MAGPTRALGRATDVDPYGFHVPDAPASGNAGPRPNVRPRSSGSGTGGPRRPGGPSGERPARKRSIIWRWRRAVFLLALLGLAMVAAGAAVLAQAELPEAHQFDQASFICAADLAPDQGCSEANAMAKLQGDDANRVNIAFDDLSPHIINAVVAVEDRDFFEHDGVAPLGIARALFRDLKGDEVQQGGSTITQQYIKKAYLSSERTLTRKLKEAVLSIKLEQRMSKEEILERYLNTVYFGRWAYGIQAASQAYFGVDAHDLNIGQAAYLAGLIRAPEAADWSLHPEEAERRRHTALVAMTEEGYVTEDEADIIDESPFDAESMGIKERPAASQVQTKKGREFGTQYVTAYVMQLLQKEPFNFTEDEILGGGLRVYTSLDMDMQQRAYTAVTSVLDRPEDPAAGLVAVDDQGMIRAMVGGRDYQTDQNNYAISGRPVGSTFKPIALAEAVATGHSLMSRYNAPAEIEIPPFTTESGTGCEKWVVNNYAESEQGNLDLMQATAQSSNTAYAQLMVDLGPEKVLAMATKLGMPEFDGLQCPTMVLGTENASVLNMAGVYSVFANRGLRKTPAIITRVERVGDEGEVTQLYTRPVDQGERVLTEQQADLVTHTLQGVITDGTGHGANIGRPAAGKTGTSQANKDAWFVGYVPKLTAAVWMGYPNTWTNPNTGIEEIPPMNDSGLPVHGRSATGGSFPADIWRTFMQSVTDARGMNDPFVEVPEEVIESGTRLGTQEAPTTTLPPQQPGGPTATDRPGNGPRPTRPGNGNNTTTTTSSTSSSSTSSSSTSSSTTTTTSPLPTITRPGGGGGNG